MAQQTNGPEHVPGDDPHGTHASSSVASSECATKGAPDSGSQSTKSGADCSTSNGSKSHDAHDLNTGSAEGCAPTDVSSVLSQSGLPASPADPKPYGTSDPVQPRRPDPAQPSRVSEPVIGASNASGDYNGEAS